MRYTNPERRDWRMIIFVLPIGILLMLFAGQLAIRMIPLWSVTGDMRSGLDPDTAAGQDPSLLPPVSQDILTPMAWLYTFLTPGPESANSGISYPSMVVLEPTSTPTLTLVVTDTPATPSATSTASTPTFTATSTKKPPVATDTPTATTPAPLCTDPAANNVGNPLPCTYDPPPLLCTDPAASNVGDPLPCIFPTGYPSVLVGVSATPPAEFNEGGPDGAPVGNVQDGSYVIVYLTGSPLIVNGPSDTNYDLAYYEIDNGSGSNIALDAVILSISKDNVTYYVVFNWGAGGPDTNSNVGDVAASTGTEEDDQVIPSSELYGTAPLQSGVLIDVDNADSEPPPGEYRYLAIQAPLAPPNDFNDGTDIDSIEVVDVAP